MSRNVSVKFAGVGLSPYRDMQMKISGWELHNAEDYFTNDDTESAFKSKTYSGYVALSDAYAKSPIYQLYYNDATSAADFAISQPVYGLQPLQASQSSDAVSIYRRQYQKYYQPSTGRDKTVAATQWEPVSVYGQGSHIHDFNVKSNTSYQYVAYPTSMALQKVEATVSGKEGGTLTGRWPCWSLIDLVEQDNPFSGRRQSTKGQVYTPSPTIKGVYLADTSNMWLFKYSVETGSVAQNLTRASIQTLGQYPKYSQGLANYESGSVSCYLGSEVLPFDPTSDYIERMSSAVATPLSTNEGAYMLKKWKDFVYSKNPKLLRDMKGQAWIVQVESPSNTPSNYIYGQPTKISFSWKEVADATGAIVYAENSVSEENGDAQVGDVGSRWEPYDAWFAKHPKVSS